MLNTITYHVFAKVIFFVALESLQVFENTSTCIFDVLFRDFKRLLELNKRFLRLANLVSPRPFRIRVSDTVKSMC